MAKVVVESHRNLEHDVDPPDEKQDAHNGNREKNMSPEKDGDPENVDREKDGDREKEGDLENGSTQGEDKDNVRFPGRK